MMHLSRHPQPDLLIGKLFIGLQPAPPPRLDFEIERVVLAVIVAVVWTFLFVFYVLN